MEFNQKNKISQGISRPTLHEVSSSILFGAQAALSNPLGEKGVSGCYVYRHKNDVLMSDRS